ncbi:MAG: hypothetical protein ACI9BD_000259 [Candidatus Marinamargulisbacteria bacterium]|jgi:hypothetical protein
MAIPPPFFSPPMGRPSPISSPPDDFSITIKTTRLLETISQAVRRNSPIAVLIVDPTNISDESGKFAFKDTEIVSPIDQSQLAILESATEFSVPRIFFNFGTLDPEYLEEAETGSLREADCFKTGIQRCGPSTSTLKTILSRLEISRLTGGTLVIMGYHAHACVKSTALRAMSEGIDVIVSLDTMSKKQSQRPTISEVRDWKIEWALYRLLKETTAPSGRLTVAVLDIPSA